MNPQLKGKSDFDGIRQVTFEPPRPNSHSIQVKIERILDQSSFFLLLLAVWKYVRLATSILNYLKHFAKAILVCVCGLNIFSELLRRRVEVQWVARCYISRFFVWVQLGSKQLPSGGNELVARSL